MLKFIPASQFLSSEESDAPSRQPPSLLLAIIAAALRYATRPDVLAVCFDKDGNNVPAALSKKLLETELLDADINTVHALLAISEVETSRNQFMSGYMYGSMAVRLLFNLRLHYGSGAETALSREEALARYWLLWNLSVQDQTCMPLENSHEGCELTFAQGQSNSDVHRPYIPVASGLPENSSKAGASHHKSVSRPRAMKRELAVGF